MKKVILGFLCFCSISFASAQNKLGAWIFLIDETGYTHSQMAAKLQQMGVKRVFIKTADGGNSCNWFPDACWESTVNAYKSRGIEPWAWSYNYPGNNYDQAQALIEAARLGYEGYVVDIEVEFDGTSTSLRNLMSAFYDAKTKAINDGLANQDFILGATTWGNPSDHSMRVDIIDDYVDVHMPQTYLEVWGDSYMQNPKRWIEAGNCEYRNMGAEKPIWHIVSAEHNQISSSTLNAFFKNAGPNASLWRVPGGGVSQAIWNDWEGVNWQQNSFPSVDCGGNNNDIPGDIEPPPPVEDPTDVKAFCPAGSEFDSQFRFCSDSSNVFGPFTRSMTELCKQRGGGNACTSEVSVVLNGLDTKLSRWSKSWFQSIRGTQECPLGTSKPGGDFGSLCADSENKEVFGPFSENLIQACDQHGGGPACYTMRWSSDFYLALKSQSGDGSGTTSPKPEIAKIEYTSLPLVVSLDEVLRVQLTETSHVNKERLYFVEVEVSRSYGSWKVASGHLGIKSGDSTAAANFNLKFNTGGEIFTKVKVYSEDKSQLLVSRQGQYSDTIATSGSGGSGGTGGPVDYIDNFPYFYQLANGNNPYGSCQNTSIAMVLKHYGANVTPDEISNYWGTSRAQTVSGLRDVFNAEAAYLGISQRVQSTQYGSISRINQNLVDGKPVIVHGYTTGYGHVLVLVGFDGTYYYAHDPYGKWDQVPYSSGYTNTSSAGRYVKYHKDAIRDAFAPDGYVWMHEIK